MDSHTEFDSQSSLTQLESLAREVWRLANTVEGNTMELLAILRILEQLHRDIRDGLFQQSLPDNRQQLYHLLREIESKGGWPYIPRSYLKSMLDKINPDSVTEELQEE
jgi:hypothetical protein